MYVCRSSAPHHRPRRARPGTRRPHGGRAHCAVYAGEYAQYNCICSGQHGVQEGGDKRERKDRKGEASETEGTGGANGCGRTASGRDLGCADRQRVEPAVVETRVCVSAAGARVMPPLEMWRKRATLSDGGQTSGVRAACSGRASSPTPCVCCGRGKI